VDFRLLGGTLVVESGRTRPDAGAGGSRSCCWPRWCCDANEVVGGTDELIVILWGLAPPEGAPKALAGHVSALRKLLESEDDPFRGGPATCSAFRGGRRQSVDAERFDGSWWPARRREE
jgi:DNA-binding SARP family transcriptional activator